MTALDTRTRLIHVAGDLVHRHGYAATGVQEICEVAGVRKGSFYHFFPSKQALVVATLHPAWLEHRELVLEPAFRPPSPATLAEGLQRWGELLAGIHRDHRDAPGGHVRGCRFGSLAAECAGREPLVAEAVAGFLTAMADYLAEQVRHAVATGECDIDDPGRAGQRLLAQMEGLAVMAKAMNDPELLTRLGSDGSTLLGMRPAHS